MNDTIDLLKIKIEKARRGLPSETINAIDAVDWRASILELRAKKGYTFEQLGDLELETELLLCGLASGETYSKELETRMRISKGEADELVNEMNDLVFKKIKEELIKSIEREKIFETSKKDQTDEAKVLHSAGIEIVPEKLEITTPSMLPKENIIKNEEGAVENREEILKKIEKPEEVHPMLAQKLSASFQTPIVKTEHSLGNITKNSDNVRKPGYTTDPYREVPE